MRSHRDANAMPLRCQCDAKELIIPQSQDPNNMNFPYKIHIFTRSKQSGAERH